MFELLTLFVLGLILGSFVAALTYRYPRGKKIQQGRSVCDFCGSKITWYDNLPLFSFFLLKGKCRDCSKRISVRYPIIELACGLGLALIGFNIFYILLFLVLISIFIIDFEHQLIPDDFIYFGLLVILLKLLGSDSSYLFPYLFSGFLASLFLLLIFLFTGGRGMGLGDVKFAVLGGMLVGLKLLFFWFMIAFILGGVVGSLLLLSKKVHLKSKIAFGPFLVISIPVVVIYGEYLLALLK